uniref:Uncharacterized protein n=1 Tax=Photinus pyralis TaxID=7054 RepID=A0A1Y1N357_PHOPY
MVIDSSAVWNTPQHTQLFVLPFPGHSVIKAHVDDVFISKNNLNHINLKHSLKHYLRNLFTLMIWVENEVEKDTLSAPRHISTVKTKPIIVEFFSPCSYTTDTFSKLSL